MSSGNAEDDGLTIEDMRWMGERLGLNVDAPDAGSDFFELMKLLVQGRSVNVGDQHLTIDLLASEMIKSQKGLGFIPDDLRTLENNLEVQTASLASSLCTWVLGEVGLDQVRKNK